jgi:hypothetical protein
MTQVQEMSLQKALETWEQDFDEETDVPSRIYHYTSTEALYGILASNCFWMTDYRYLNDPSEFTHSLSIIELCLNCHSGEFPVGVLGQLKEFFNYTSSVTGNKVGPCILSFSQDGDSLYQWRAYADDGTGVCIGIEPPRGDDCYIRNLRRVIYDRKEQELLVQQRIKEFLDICGRHDIHSWKATHILYRVLMRLGTYLKHHAYRKEREWRYSNFMAGSSDMPVRLTRRGLVPYFRATQIVDDNNKLPIREIRLGPRQDEPKSKYAVELLLRQHGYDPVKVEISKRGIPYQ